MLQLIKYYFLQSVREKMMIFWLLAFPMILGTLFHFAFGGIVSQQQMSVIPAAIVGEDKSFEAFAEAMDGILIDAEEMSEKEAEEALADDKVKGIFKLGGEKVVLNVNANGIEESILASAADMYEQNKKVILDVMENHPERMGEVLAGLKDYKSYTEETSLGGRSFNMMESYFFALIAMTCLYGGFLGVYGVFSLQADLSALGQRNSISSTNRLQMILGKMITIFGCCFICILLVTGYLAYVLKGIDISGNVGKVVLLCAFGGAIGVSMGILIGTAGKGGVDKKTGLFVALTMFMCFLSGLMVGNIRYIIRQKAPVIDQINPASVISDAFYSICIYDDPGRYAKDLWILGGMTVLLLTVAFLRTRRVRYDSI